MKTENLIKIFILIFPSCFLNRENVDKHRIDKNNCQIPDISGIDLLLHEQKEIKFTCKDSSINSFEYWKLYLQKNDFSVGSCDHGMISSCSGFRFSLYFANINTGIFGELYVNQNCGNNVNYINTNYKVRIQNSELRRYPEPWNILIAERPIQNNLDFIPLETELYCVLAGLTNIPVYNLNIPSN